MPPDRWLPRREAHAIWKGAGLRTRDVEGNHPHPQWTVAPLLDAGLDVDDVRTLLLRVTFECLVGGRNDVSDVSAFLGEQPRHVRAAWIETVDRMLGTTDIAPAT